MRLELYKNPRFFIYLSKEDKERQEKKCMYIKACKILDREIVINGAYKVIESDLYYLDAVLKCKKLNDLNIPLTQYPFN